jgi:Protein required for biogenesis of the 60S ribosomal subunit
MLTFLELYQTILGFVLFKLYTDVGLVYPPPVDIKKDEGAAGVGVFSLLEASHSTAPAVVKVSGVGGKTVSSKDVRQTIKTITADSQPDDADMTVPGEESGPGKEEGFVHQPSTVNPQESSSLPTLQDISALPQSLKTDLFLPYTFFLSREISRPTFEFLIRSFGGRVGWPSSSGSGSPFQEMDDSITHFIVDRHLLGNQTRLLRNGNVVCEGNTCNHNGWWTALMREKSSWRSHTRKGRYSLLI